MHKMPFENVQTGDMSLVQKVYVCFSSALSQSEMSSHCNWMNEQQAPSKKSVQFSKKVSKQVHFD